MTIDVDSTICAVAGKTKAGAAYGHTKQLGYHPLVGVRADTGEILHTRLRRGSSRAARLISFPRRSPAPGAPAPPGDSVCAPTRGSSATTSSTVWIASRCPGRSPSRCMATSKPPSAPFPRRTGRPLPTPSAAKRTSLRPQLSPDGAATSARSASSCAAPTSPTRPRANCGRTGATTRSSPTEPTLDPIAADKYHRQHATVELAIRDLKASTGLAHLPSGNFAANAAWLTCAALAHNLYRWINHHTGRRRNGKLTVGQTVRNQLLALPGRLVNHAGRTILRLPTRWPWAPTFHTTVANIRALPQLA